MRAETIKAAKITGAATIMAAIIAALIAGLFQLAKKDDSGLDVNSGGDVGCVNFGNGNVCEVAGRPRATTTLPPSGKAPFKFRTVNTWDAHVDRGVKVRACNLEECEQCPGGEVCQLGNIAGNSTVYADCKQLSAFNPEGKKDGDSLWFKIRWPSDKVDRNKVLASSSDDKFAGWIFGSYLEADGHNGDIPDC